MWTTRFSCNCIQDTHGEETKGHTTKKNPTSAGAGPSSKSEHAGNKLGSTTTLWHKWGKVQDLPASGVVGGMVEELRACALQITTSTRFNLLQQTLGYRTHDKLHALHSAAIRTSRAADQTSLYWSNQVGSPILTDSNPLHKETENNGSSWRSQILYQKKKKKNLHIWWPWHVWTMYVQ